MGFNYKALSPAVIGASDRKPGQSDVVLFAPMGDFTDIKVSTVSAAPGDTKKITAAHTFPEDNGFIEIQCKAKSVEGAGDAQGETGGQVATYKYKCIIKGDGPVILEFLENMLNEDCIFLFNDPQCGVDNYVQLGSKCSPAQIGGYVYRGGSRGAGGFKEYEFTVESTDKNWYSGAVTKKPVE